MDKVLIAEDEKVTRVTLARILEKEGVQVIQAVDGLQALEAFRREAPSAVILDIMMPVMNGLDTIRALKDLDASVPVIIATGRGDISSAVETMKLGAYDFLVKPVEPGKLIMTVKRALEKHRLDRELLRLHIAENASLERFMGKAPAMKRIAEQLKQVAVTDFSVIIQGETGTGKTLLAKILHNLSGRAARIFMKIDLGSMAESIIEGELFGYEKGAFTGAVQAREGFFEAAAGGTAFLDDLENISAAGAKQASFGDREQGDLPAGQQKAHRARRPVHGRDEHRPAEAGSGGQIPRRPLLPPGRVHHNPASPARAQGRYPSFHQHVPRQRGLGAQDPAQVDQPCSRGPDAAPPVARQSPGTEECGPAGGAHVRRQRDRA